ncbi:MAG: type III-A CRISPR-associated RAMP protein Csm3 [Chloroflexi bacterium]|nr:type III-A CRISPR-associated RAMP protein Csm3 [Chloroflexota bacterium]
MTLKLRGRVFITSEIVAVTGLHIGGSGGAFAIGGVDNPVIKNQINGQPYIPGSSLRGKMRSLTEKYLGEVTGQPIGNEVEIHTCKNQDAYEACPICNIYGISAGGTERNNPIANWPSRLVVRDVPLTPDSAERLQQAKTSLPFTEVKTEVAIDRVTSQANLRDIERVPAGAVFGPMELVYSIYDAKDVEWLSVLLDGMDLLQDDYLGGSGSRGGGKVVFADLDLMLKRAGDYRSPIHLGHYPTLSDLSQDFGAVINRIWDELRNGA